MNLKEVLANIGLEEKEVSIYLAALELGPSPASEIAEKAKINRVSSYDIFEKLIQRGLISTYTQNNVRYFAATDPDIMMEDYQQKVLNLKVALPYLKQLKGAMDHPKVSYFEGFEAVKKLYIDSLSAQTEILNYADSKLVRIHWPNYDKEYVMERVQRKIYLRGIAPRDSAGKKVMADDEAMHREIRLVDPKRFLFKNEINIYDDKVSIISFNNDKVLGMLIESGAIAETQRSIFKMAWEFAEV